jgi:hypothetical protein
VDSTRRNRNLHIADLSPEEQGALRKKVYDVLSGLPCFYEAIHVQGFHAAYEGTRELVEKAAELAKTGPSSRHSEIKVSKPRAEAGSLHVELFLGLYAKILAFCLERRKTDLKIEIRTDRIDGPILEKFHKEAERFLGDKITVEVKGWNPSTESVVKGSFSLTFLGEPSPFLIQECLIRPAASDDDLVLAADVLANSLNHLFCERGPEVSSAQLQGSNFESPFQVVPKVPRAVAFAPAAFEHFKNRLELELLSDRALAATLRTGQF